MNQLQDENVFAIILAGGSGTRFWPKSRQKWPKQLCALGSDPRAFIEITLDRLENFVPVSRRMIVTHRDQIEATRGIVQEKCLQLIAEPSARNTAAALALAALDIEAQAKDPKKAVMISLHADHVIKRVDIFLRDVARAVELAREGFLTLLGIVPTYPETGYGYIEMGDKLGEHAFKVKSFREKPQRAVAEDYIQSKKYLWNAGLFVFPNAFLLEELQKNLPQMMQKLRDFSKSAKKPWRQIPPDAYADLYKDLEKISIDHAVLEKSNRIAVVPTDIGWKDVGSWDALPETFGGDAQGNYVQGNTVLLDTKNCVVESDGPLIATLGVENLIVVHHKGAILVCAKSRSQDVKNIVETLEKRGLKDLL